MYSLQYLHTLCVGSCIFSHLHQATTRCNHDIIRVCLHHECTRKQRYQPWRQSQHWRHAGKRYRLGRKFASKSGSQMSYKIGELCVLPGFDNRKWRMLTLKNPTVHGTFFPCLCFYLSVCLLVRSFVCSFAGYLVVCLLSLHWFGCSFIFCLFEWLIGCLFASRFVWLYACMNTCRHVGK